MNYKPYLSLIVMRDIGVLDDIAFKFFKDLNKLCYINVNIVEAKCGKKNWCKEKINFSLSYNISDTKTPIMVDKKFCKKVEYPLSSPIYELLRIEDNRIIQSNDNQRLL